MNYALFFFGPNSFDVIPTDLGEGFTERTYDSTSVPIIVAPQHYVDKYLRLNPDSEDYWIKRTNSRTTVAKRDAILSYYGDTYAYTYTSDNERETTAEVIRSFSGNT